MTHSGYRDFAEPGGVPKLSRRITRDLCAEVISDEDGPPVVFLTGNSDVPMSVRAMRDGAVDFLLKPASEDDLIEAVSRASALNSERTLTRTSAQ